MSDSIQVAIKVRPLIKREKDENLQIQWAVADNVIVPVDPEKKRGESVFQFDHIFDPDKTNSDVFETVVKPIVDAAVKGFNGTVFAYGQTSSGKTHTMLGTLLEPGVIPMAVERMFDFIAETCGREFLLRVSYLEIYNEKVNDLLDTSGIDLKLREDSNGLVQVLKCKEEIASSPEAIMAIMKKGDKNRRIGETDMNERSSRSHTIFRITIESREQSSDSDGAVQVSQLNLVDLAGSERARQTNATGERFKEGTHINMSLSTLGLVIKQLSESSDNTKYINFRDSKLTRLLQASLGGNAMTTIICAVTPAAFDETQCTLWFASRAKSVKNKPQLNEVMSDAALLKRYKKQLAKLHEELEKLKSENRIAEVQEMESKLQEKEHKLQETDRLNQLLEERIQLLKNGIVSANGTSKDDSNTKIPRSKRRRTWAGDRALISRFSLCTRNLPTIEEMSSPDSKSSNSDKLNHIKSRKSIIQTVDLNNESFETAFTDFELELIKVAKEREEEIDTTIHSLDDREFRRVKTKSENRVKFQDDVEIYRLSSDSNQSEMSTPEKRKSVLNSGDRVHELPSSPGTPKSVLRERLNYLTEEYNALQEFTTLERQILSAQQLDFESPTEKIFMQKQIHELSEKFQKFNTYQVELEEQLSVCLNCINALTSRMPDISELWKSSLFDDEKNEVDTFSELKKLEELLKNLENKQSNTEKTLTPLEKKLSDDYNECLKELEEVRLQKEFLFKENTEIKKMLADESTKLKNVDILVNTLRNDTDCLMEKLIQKNSELAKLKEKIVDLERFNNEMEKSSFVNDSKIPIEKGSYTNASELISIMEVNENNNNEVSRLNEIIEEKMSEITKYRQFEEKMKEENECLLKSLDAILKIEKKSEECQTEMFNEENMISDLNKDKDIQISKLSDIIQDKSLSIASYQQLEIEMKNKIKELQQCLNNIANNEMISQECQTEHLCSDNEGNDILLTDINLTAEESKLLEIISHKTLEIEHLKQFEKQMKEEIEQLKSISVVKVEQKSQECQYQILDINEENHRVYTTKKDLEKDLEISRLEHVINEKTIEIEEKSDIIQSSMDILNQDKSNEITGLLEIIHLKSIEIESYKKSENEMRKEIEKLHQMLNNVEKLKQTSAECHSQDFIEKYEIDLNQEKDTKIINYLEIIQEKSLEIEKYKYAEQKMKEEIKKLQLRLDTVKKIEMFSIECQTECAFDSDKLTEADLNQSLEKEISKQLKINEEKTLEIEKYKQIKEEMKIEIDQLKQYLSNKVNEKLSIECQTEYLELEDNQISKQSKIIEEKTLEIEKYKQMKKEMKTEMEQLKQYLNNKKTDQGLAEDQTDYLLSNNLHDNKLCQAKDNEILKLLDIIAKKEVEIVQYKQNEEKIKQEIDDLQKCIKKSVFEIDKVSKEFQAGNISKTEECNETDTSLKINSDIYKFLAIVSKMTLEIKSYKQKEEELKNEIKCCQHCINANKIQCISQAICTEEIPTHDNRKVVNEENMSSQINFYQEEIAILKNCVIALKQDSIKTTVEFEEKVRSINNDLDKKIKDIEELKSLNSVLRNGIDDKTKEISNLQEIFNTKIQEIEEKINTLTLEKNKLKEKIASINSNNLSSNFEKEVVNLEEINIKLKIENNEFKKNIEELKEENNKINLSVINLENSLCLTTPAKSNAITSVNNSLTNSTIELKENQQSTHAGMEKDENITTDLKSFAKPTDIIESKSPACTSVKSNVSAMVNDNKNFKKPLIKTMELESSSIFANMTYFDEMEVGQSFTQDCTTLLSGMDDTEDMSQTSTNIDSSMVNKAAVNTTTLIDNVKEINKSEIESTSFVKLEPLSIEDFEKIKVTLEKENARLHYDLQKKIQETEEVQKVVTDFKKTLEELQQTIYILTNENMDMSKLLTEARENNNQIVNDFQKEIDILTSRLSAITQEKVTLKSEIMLMNEQFENMRAITPVITDEEMKHKFLGYQEKIKALTEENIDLSTNLMEKIEELEKVKESKIQIYDHDCTYREKCEFLNEKIQCLEKENIELSSELTEQIEECDKLKETTDVLQKKLEVYAFKQSSDNDSNQNDVEFLRQENTKLTNELIELRTKLIQLNRENANLSSHLALENSDEHNESVHSFHHMTLNTSSIALDALTSEENINDMNTAHLNKKVKCLQEQVEYLTLLNKKLGDLKLPNCSQCAHLKELNESRRKLKLEVKSLNQKLSDLQKKFDQKCADTEVLRTKATEDFNSSLNLMDLTFNGSIYDGVNVTIIEEKVQILHSELEELKENHNKLSNQYKEKCNELEKLQFDKNASSSPVDKKESKRSKSDTSSRKTFSRIQSLQKDLDKLSNDLQEIKKSNANFSTTLNKFMTERNEIIQEIESVKLLNEELKKECNNSQANLLNYEEKVKLLEEELETLYKQIEATNVIEKEIRSQKLEIEVQLESLSKEKSELVNTLHNTQENYKKEIDECNSRVHNFEKENINLKNELQKLEDIIHSSKKKNENYLEEKLKEEIDAAKSRIFKELKSLTNLSETELKELPKKSVTDIFLSFLNVILSKETEIVKKLQEEFEKTKRKLEEEKQQSIDAEKRTSVWAKTVEADLEKLQGDLTDQEKKNYRLQDEIYRLKECLKEVQYENQQLHNNIATLELDLNSLHNELDKKSRTNVDKEIVMSAIQEKERLAKTKEEEWENRLQFEKEEFERKLKDLNTQLESYKSINNELKNTVEGLDLEAKHLKNTINIKSNDCINFKHKIEELQVEIEHMENNNQQLKNEILEKNKHINEITGLLKIKCDLLTEYKTKVETMKPEYENLQAQISERKISLEKYKEEIHNLKLENKKQIDILQDKLSDEGIRYAGLNKQVAELKNKNTTLSNTIEEFKDRCAELERENTILQRKVRNSTSKVKVENEMQELHDENRSLKNHLEGSYNRIKELQETKSQVQRELAEAEAKNGLLEQELETTKIALDSLREKYNNLNLQKLREKYELILREKNNIILEVEEKKMLIASKDQKLVEYQIEMDTLNKQKEALDKELENVKKEKVLLENRISNLINVEERLKEKLALDNIEKDQAYKFILDEKNKIFHELENCKKEISEILSKNKELDEEMDDLVNHIHKQENEIAELQDRLIVGSSNGNMEKLKSLEDDMEKLRIDLRVTELNRDKLQTEVIRLNSEKEFLLNRIDDLNSKIAEIESKNSSRSSSKSNSPTCQKGRRRLRRSDLYNQNRNLDLDSDSKEITDTESPSITPIPSIKSIEEECCTCSELRNRIREMSLDIVSRNNKITMLEMQLQSENFPYQIKCNELQENLLSANTRNSELKLEIQKLQRALMEDSSRECHVCRQKKRNNRDQSVQVNEENKIFMSGMSSGIVEDHLRLQKMEKERNMMKELCRTRARKIKELEEHIRELEGLKIN